MQWLVIGVQSLILLEGFVWSFCNLSGCMKSKTRLQAQMHTGSSLDHVFLSKWTKKKKVEDIWLRNVNEAITRQVVLGMDSFLSVPVLCMVWSTVSMFKVTKCRVFTYTPVYTGILCFYWFSFHVQPDQFFAAWLVVDFIKKSIKYQKFNYKSKRLL